MEPSPGSVDSAHQVLGQRKADRSGTRRAGSVAAGRSRAEAAWEQPGGRNRCGHDGGRQNGGGGFRPRGGPGGLPCRRCSSPARARSRQPTPEEAAGAMGTSLLQSCRGQYREHENVLPRRLCGDFPAGRPHRQSDAHLPKRRFAGCRSGSRRRSCSRSSVCGTARKLSLPAASKRNGRLPAGIAAYPTSGGNKPTAGRTKER